MPAEILPVGKLPVELLQGLLARHGGQDERLVVGPRVGEDAAVLDLGERYLVVKSDPITFATDEIGRYVVTINANDIATMGATPRWFLLTLMLPEGQTDRELVERIFEQVDRACRALEVVLCGGHTEITAGVDRPLAVGVMLGEVDKADLVQTAGARPGDAVLLTKGIAIEGTAVLARELGGELASQVGHEASGTRPAIPGHARYQCDTRRRDRAAGRQTARNARPDGRRAGDRPVGAGAGQWSRDRRGPGRGVPISRDGRLLPGAGP